MSKGVFLQLLKAETEQEITSIIEKEGMEDPLDWQPYGNQSSNWSIIGNQSSSAERALVEKITNSVDALLMRKCLELGIDPRSEEAPKSPREALIQFFDIEDGKISNLSKEKEEKICKDLYIMATSQDMKPIKKLGRNAHVNMMIYDGGEGQSPNRLPDTILSLLRGNKQGIPFTQGNYNQGGSGALMYCGEQGYCLVVSRRHPNIAPSFQNGKDDSLHLWGWTLIRLEMRQDTKDPMFTYYAPNGKVPRFEADSLPLKPKIIKGKEAQNYLDYDSSCSAGLPYEQEVEYGTAMKLYNYNLKQKGPLVSHFKYELSSCILDTYLPFYVVDCRKNKFNNHILFRGFNKLLEDDLKEKNEDNRLINKRFPMVTSFKVDTQEVQLTTYGLNHRGSGKKNEQSFIRDSSPIRFTLGQQFQGDVNKSVISNAGLGVLKDSLLIIVEFPNLDPTFKKDLFMTDRERLLDKKPKKEIMNQIKSFLNQNETLKDFASEKMQSIMTEETENDPNVKSALEKWIEKSPEMQQMLGFGSWFLGKGRGSSEDGTIPGSKRPTGGLSVPIPPEQIETKEFPTYFEPILRESAEDEYFITVTKGKRFTIRFKTDVNEEFFTRVVSPGMVTVEHKGIETDQFNVNIKNGKASFSFTDKLTSKIAETELEFKITCPDHQEVQYIYQVKLKVMANEELNEDNKDQGFTGLPPMKEITQDDWTEDMTEKTGAVFQTNGNEIIYLINMDNVFLKNKLDATKSEGEKEFYKRLFKFAMLFSAMSTKNYEDDIRKHSENADEIKETIEEAVAKATESVARTFFVMEQLSANLRSSISQTV